ncbi:MAG: flagellar biosynthesis protein FlhA [Planctomycetota bacterium]|jgi:flagellar biosynthesis protein FlhA
MAELKLATPAISANGRSEPVMAAALISLVGILLVPMPGPMLDFLIALNLAMTVMLLLITLSARQALDFAVFPSMLLLLTLFRLTLTVSTTRAILLHGEAGAIVRAFGDYVVQRNLLVGLVVFGILVVIQFVVVTKGAGRISEVAARFVLDAMPGKQMAIDAELNAGAIDEPEARRRREHLMREAEFHGAMDGASKFVRGDAIAGLIITAINLIGGIIMGMMRGMELGGAVHTYSVLTIGDSLVSQMPAFIIALASGILVTKATSQKSLGQEIGAQVMSNSQPLVISAVVLLGLAAVPGLPKLPFVGLAIGLWIMTNIIKRRDAQPAPEPTPDEVAQAVPLAERASSEAIVDDFLQSDRVGIEIGARLIPLAKPELGNVLVDRVMNLRRDLAKKNGIWVPSIRIRDNIQMDPEAYRFFINGREVARGSIRVNSLLALTSGEPLFSLQGEATTEPAFGLPAKWIVENDKARAELAGYTVVDAISVLITHLSEALRKHAAELLGREDLRQLLDKVKETSPTLVDELVPNVLTMGNLHRVLTLLLEENVPISNMTRILESLASQPPTLKDPVELSERVRNDLGRIICDRFRDSQSMLAAIVLDPRLELELRRSLNDRNLILEPARLEKLIVSLANAWRKAHLAGKPVALLTDASLRRPLRQALIRSLPDLSVIAYTEVPNDCGLQPVALIRPDEALA